MKINSEYNQSYLLQQNSIKNVETNKQIKEYAYLFGDSPVQIDISAEGMKQYKNTLQQDTLKNETDKKSDNFITYNLAILTNHNVELSARINEINKGKAFDKGKENLTIKDQANSILEAYASLYAEIVEGYNKGTRCVDCGSVEGRPLTKEEDLAKLNEAFESYTKTFEKLYYIEQEAQKSLEKDLRHTIWGKSNRRAQEYLQELERKKENPEYIPSNISDPILDAGKSFLLKVSSLNNIDRKSAMTIISSINIW